MDRLTAQGRLLPLNAALGVSTGLRDYTLRQFCRNWI